MPPNKKAKHESDKITIVIVGTDSFRRKVTRLVHDALLENEELEGQEKAGNGFSIVSSIDPEECEDE